MEFAIFLVVIVVLILVHEFGHLVVAKLSGMRVDEFGLGYPPRIARIGKIGETELSLNWLPFGGFVRIYGEDATAAAAPDPRAFGARPRILQALVLLAGVAMNMLLAYALLVAALAAGTPQALADSQLMAATHVELAIAQVLPSSPAASAGVLPGDIITSASDKAGEWSASEARDTATFGDYVAASGGAPITLAIDRNGRALSLSATPARGLIPDDPSRYALGLSIASIGVLPLSLEQSLTQGASLLWGVTKETAVGLGQFFGGLFTFHADLSQVSGPIGIAHAFGGAAQTGFGDVLSLAALISINLAFINLIPIPALDGGRLLFVIIEAVIRRPLKPALANAINSICFMLLIVLMLVVSAHDLYLYR